jgi:hypothetical protein
VVPLNKPYFLQGAAVGFYHGQPWPSMGLYVTADPAVGTTNNWKQVFYSATTVSSQTIPFDEAREARFVKLYSPSGTWNALCELELYAVPPPVGTVILLK